MQAEKRIPLSSSDETEGTLKQALKEFGTAFGGSGNEGGKAAKPAKKSKKAE